MGRSKNWIACLFALICSTVLADEAAQINTISYQIEKQAWATTQSALVSLAVHATLSNQGMGNLQNDVLKNAQKVSPKTDWHLIQFSRAQNQSGLETVNIMIEGRVPSDALSDIRGRAKAISEPGVVYEVANIQFTPSESEIDATRETLRESIYQQAKAEMQRLATIYPQSCLSIHQIQFDAAQPGGASSLNAMLFASAKQMLPNNKPEPPEPLEIKNKVSEKAVVVISIGCQKGK